MPLPKAPNKPATLLDLSTVATARHRAAPTASAASAATAATAAAGTARPAARAVPERPVAPEVAAPPVAVAATATAHSVVELPSRARKQEPRAAREPRRQPAPRAKTFVLATNVLMQGT